MPAFDEEAIGGGYARRMWATRRLSGRRSGWTRVAESCGAGAFSPGCAKAHAYDEDAREEELTPERVRQIVREALAERIVDDETDHAKLQLARLAQAMRTAGMAVADGDVTAIPAFLKGARSARPLPAGRQDQPGL
jgi:hypothetical protein